MSAQKEGEPMSRRNRREEPTTLTSLGKTGDILSQAFDKIYFTHKDTTNIVKIVLLGDSFQTMMTWERYDGNGRCTYLNRNARQELDKLRNQNSYKIAYVINDGEKQELVFEPDLS